VVPQPVFPRERGTGARGLERLEPARLQSMLIRQPPPTLRRRCGIIVRALADFLEAGHGARGESATLVSNSFFQQGLGPTFARTIGLRLRHAGMIVSAALSRKLPALLARTRTALA
jgi:hypothetical protein